MNRLTVNLEERVIAKAHDQAVTVRFPPGLLNRLDDSAARRGRSRNSDIVMRLIKSLDSDDLDKTFDFPAHPCLRGSPG